MVLHARARQPRDSPNLRPTASLSNDLARGLLERLRKQRALDKRDESINDTDAGTGVGGKAEMVLTRVSTDQRQTAALQGSSDSSPAVALLDSLNEPPLGQRVRNIKDAHPATLQ